MNPQLLGTRLAIAALVSDEEFSRLYMLADTYDLVRADSVDRLRELFLTGSVAGAFIGTLPLSDEDCAKALSQLARSFPFYPLVGVLARRPSGSQVVYAFHYGRIGVTRVVEIHSHFAEARKVFTEIVDPFLSRAVAQICENVGSPNVRRFITECFRPEVTTSKELFRRLGIHPSSGISRFFRIGLPSPKQYVAWAKLTYAAHIGRMPGVALPQIADRVHASSPQSFGRTVKAFTGLTGTQFRERFSGESMIALYREQLIDPYIETLASFDPMRNRVGEAPDREADHRLSA